MPITPGFYSRREAADLLGISPQRVSILAKRDDWAAYRVGRSWLYAADDVHRAIALMKAQKAWKLLGIPRNLWGQWWLADLDEIEYLDCPQCGDVAYSPAGATKWSRRAACPSCGATRDEILG